MPRFEEIERTELLEQIRSGEVTDGVEFVDTRNFASWLGTEVDRLVNQLIADRCHGQPDTEDRKIIADVVLTGLQLTLESTVDKLDVFVDDQPYGGS